MNKLSNFIFLIILFAVGIFICLLVIKKAKSYFNKILNVLIDNIKLILNYSRLYILVSFCFSIIQGICPIISLLLMQKIINLIQIENIEKYIFFNLILVYIFIEMFDLIISEIYNLYSVNFTKKFSKHVEVLMLEKANRLTTKDFENKEIYDLINRAQSQNGSTVIDYFNSWISILQNCITIVSSIIIIVSYKFWIFILIIIIPLVQFYYSQRLGREQYDISIERTHEERKCWYINFLMLLGNSTKETILYGLGNLFISQYKKLKDKFIYQDFKIMKKTFIINIISISIGQVISGSIFAYILFNGFTKKIYLGNVTTYITCLTTIKTGIEMILTMMSTIYSKSLYMELLFKFFKIPEKVDYGDEKIKVNNIEKIELKNVSFKFSKTSEYVLKNINMKINKNKAIALVGRNGSGKSTLIKLLLGLYDDYEGEILVNDINLNDIDKQSYYKKISCVFQDYNRYEASVKENVGYGNLSQIDNEDLITQCLLKCGFDINLLGDNKLDTILGYWFGESQLSDGQWQKIAIARAMTKEADFFILDEPDAALDGISEIDMLKNYKNLLKNKLGIFVSHKTHHLNLLCENIVVLDNGKIAELGVHDELIKQKGIYYQLYSSQIIEKLTSN